MIRIGVLGYGYWGPKVARSIEASQRCVLAGISDLSETRLIQARASHPHVFLTRDWKELMSRRDIDAVAIAVPVRSHFETALACIIEGKHVFIEKPMTRTASEALRLVDESARRGTVLMVDHTFLFSPEVTAIRKLVQQRELGRLCSWDSHRLNWGIVRGDVNVAWDLASHDLSILDNIVSSAPCAVSAWDHSPAHGEREHMTHIALTFPDRLVANIHSSWISPTKVRHTVIGGSLGSLVYDDLAPRNKLTMRGHQETRTIETTPGEPLALAVEHFAQCIEQACPAISGGAAGLRVVRLLEAVDTSLASGGRAVELEEGVLS